MRRPLVHGAAQWVVAILGAEVFSEHNPRRARWACEKPATVYGTSTFHWWPPGRVCRYHDGSVSTPSEARTVVPVELGVSAVAGVTIVGAYARRCVNR